MTAELGFVLVCVMPAFVISFLATAGMRRLAPRWGLIDQPAARKVHFTPTALGGGLAIILGVLIPLGAAHLAAVVLTTGGYAPTWIPERIAVHIDGVAYRAGEMWGVLAAGFILAVMGFIDDLKQLPWLPRLFVQLCIAVGLTFGGVQATVFVPIPWFGIALTVLWILVLVNAFNFLDNMDGLCAGIALIAAVMFAVIMLFATSEPRWLVGGTLLVLAGSLAGFLCHNWPPATIFMGDAGSYFIGLLLACSTVLGTFYEEGAAVASFASVGRHVMLAPLCILAVPLYDFCSVVLIRLSQRRSPFHPDKNHFSHRLVELGLNSRYAVMTVHLATLTTGLGGLLLYHVRDWAAAGLVVGLVACVLAIIAILETAGRRKRKVER
jgi:UDP-GlcNAc:undecaprenyl-phosphate/decaprenyl-phosphate GlcNAc-1-phosphate transferase